MNFFYRPTFVIKTLGCKVNQYESQVMREDLIGQGFIDKGESDDANFYIINSCTVTHRADKDTRNLIRRFHRINPSAKIVVAGCYVERPSDRSALLGIPGVTHFIRNSEKDNISGVLFGKKDIQRSDKTISYFADHSRAFIKIQDGCDNRCSYCKVPLVRGPSRSRDVENILAEIERLLEKGLKEIVLCGICLGNWGNDFEPKKDLTNLLERICKLRDSFRIRLSSIEPIYVTDSVISLIKENEKICKHLHTPMQSGDDKILKSMNRPYTANEFARIIKNVRKNISDIAITTDVLVGFPGEDEKSFLKTLRFIKRMKPSRMHIFSYSPREGTQAWQLKNDVDKQDIRKRIKILSDLNRKFSADYARRFIGNNQSILIEVKRDLKTNLLVGYTDRYIRVYVSGDDKRRNTISSITVTAIDETRNAVFGSLCDSTKA